MNKILLENYEEYTFNSLEIHNHCKELGYNYKIHQNNKVVVVETGLDSWKLVAKQFINNGKAVNRIEVKHYNRGGNKKGKMQYHFQTYADTIGYVLQGIIKTHNHGCDEVDDLLHLKDIFNELGVLKYA